MNKYVIDLASAFMKVNITNYEWQALNRRGNHYTQEAENNFSSEIVRHFRNLMDEPHNNIFYRNKGLYCHFDVRKSRVSIQPDIVLHHSPNNQDKQEFLAEVKTTNTLISSDLDKIKRAISNELNFKYGIMIVVNKPLEPTINEISNFKINNQGVEFKKLILFHSIIIDQEPNYTITPFSQIQN